MDPQHIEHMNIISIRKGKERVERRRGYKPRKSFMV
jgi:hypothetical protein